MSDRPKVPPNPTPTSDMQQRVECLLKLANARLVLQQARALRIKNDEREYLLKSQVCKKSAK